MHVVEWALKSSFHRHVSVFCLSFLVRQSFGKEKIYALLCILVINWDL